MIRRNRSSRTFYVKDISDIRLQKPFIVICDRNLPASIRHRFPDAISISPGESAKSLDVVKNLASLVLRNCADRSVTIVAVGGGSIGDLVGFLASILWRGVGLVHVPTTLLAMADSAHGGKTAVNLPEAKNQLGSFHPAEEIWIVRSILESMPDKLVREGLSEVVKAALIGDSGLAKKYLRDGLEGVEIFSALRSAISVKQAVCKKDPFETQGVREILNFGHTLGHAVEITTGLPHGRAVAWGMCAGIVLSRPFGFREEDKALELIRPLMLKPSRWPSDAALTRAMSYDKKRRGTLRSVVLAAPGKAKITNRITPKDWIRAFVEVRERFYG